MSLDEAARARRLAKAAELAWVGGQGYRAVALGARAEASSDDPLVVARASYVRACHEIQHGVPREAVSTLLAAVNSVAEVDPDTALRLLLVAVQEGGLAGQLESALESARRLENLLGLSGTQEEGFLTAVFAAIRWASEGGVRPSFEQLRGALAQADHIEDPRLRLLAIPGAAYIGDIAWARTMAERATDRTRGSVQWDFCRSPWSSLRSSTFGPADSTRPGPTPTRG